VITDYASLQAAIADYLARTDLTTQITTFINQGESRIYRDLRVEAMIETINATVTTNAVPVPADYLEMRDLWVSVNGGLQAMERVSSFWLHSQFPLQSSSGSPYYYAREGANFILAPYPDGGYTIAGQYYGRLASLSNSNTSNWLTTSNPDLIFAAAMLEAGTYLMDPQAVPYWEGRYQQIMAGVQQADRNERHSGSARVLRAG